jgi:hypothetical protein
VRFSICIILILSLAGVGAFLQGKEEKCAFLWLFQRKHALFELKYAASKSRRMRLIK